MTGIRAVVLGGFAGLCGLAGAPVTAVADAHALATYGPILTGCYEAAEATEAKALCLGRMSAVCMETEDGGQTTLGMTICLSAEADAWDGYLNAEYAETRGWAEASDEAEAVYSPDFAVRVEKLREAQRAWIAFRDAECALEYAEWGAGSMRNIAYADCRMRMTADRTLDLRRMRETY